MMEMIETLTAQYLIDSLTGDSLLAICINLIVFLLGLFLNVYRRIVQEDITLRQYWETYKTRSIASIGTLGLTFLGMVLMSPTAPLYAYFSMAYMGDALANRAPRREEV
jgi:cytochrome c oxidase assembly factor CtaG